MEDFFQQNPYPIMMDYRIRYYVLVDEEKVYVNFLPRTTFTRSDIVESLERERFSIKNHEGVFHANDVQAEAEPFAYYPIYVAMAIGMLLSWPGVIAGALIGWYASRANLDDSKKAANRFNNTYYKINKRPIPEKSIKESDYTFFTKLIQELLDYHSDKYTMMITKGDIKIQMPIRYVDFTSDAYGMLIKDDSGRIHYFNEDGSYDYWSMPTNISEN
jgi:hypothetical protein